MKPAPQILVAGIGNVFWGDDAFGVEVVRRLARRDWPAGVRIVDFGIRGLDLAYALLEQYDAVILIDATERGGEPGSLYVIEPEVESGEAHDSQSALIETHAVVPENSLRWAGMMGARVPCLRLVGCEPQTVGSADDMMMGLSDPVQAAVGPAARIVEQLVRQIRSQEHGLPV